MSFSLRRANKQELNEIVDELQRKNTPASLPSLLLLKTYINYPFTNKNVYVSEDPRYKSFLAVTNVYNNFSLPTINLYWDHELLSEDDIRNLLKCIPDWEWSEYFIMYYIVEPLCRKILKILSEDEFCGRPLIKHIKSGKIWSLSERNIQNFTLPDGYKIGQLLPCHASYILSKWIWPYARFQDLETTKRFFQTLPSIGIFREEDNILESNPVSYAVMVEVGMIGMTSTDKEHQGKGLAAFAETELAKIILRKGMIPSVYIRDDNNISIKFHRKVGYHEVSREGAIYLNFDSLEEIGVQKIA